MKLTQTPPWRLATKILPPYAVLPLLCCPVLNMLVYNGGQLLAKGHKHYDFTLPIEETFPVVPAWTIVYVGCFAVWIINFILICREDRAICYRFLAAEAIAKVICGLFFVFLPTTNVRPELTGSDPFTWGDLFLRSPSEPLSVHPLYGRVVRLAGLAALQEGAAGV